MASVSQFTQGNLLPFRIYNDGDVINWYSLDGTGLNGQLVSIETGVLSGAGVSGQLSSQNPEVSYGGYLPGVSVGASYTNVISYRYANNRKVRASVSGDSIYNALGFTLHTTATVDENLNPLVNLPYDRVTERGYVLSGFSVPILTQGVFTLKSTNYNGTPLPGYAICITSGGAAGSVDIVNPSNLTVLLGTGLTNTLGAMLGSPTTVYNPWTVVGKCLSTSGVNFGGYAQFKVLL